jgi:predicted RNA-binding Zn ribbon-like protein
MVIMFETEKFSLVGNVLFLDFVNTLKMRDGEPYETLDDLHDFLGWSMAAGLLDERRAEELANRWSNLDQAGDFLAEAKNFRRKLHDAVDRMSRGREPAAAVVAAVNEILKTPSGYAELEKTGEGFVKRFRFEPTDPRQLLQPIAESFADFLCYSDFRLLRKCEGASCVLYFYDTTKNHKRRWCSMKACGNQAKAAAFYRRKKAETRP